MTSRKCQGYANDFAAETSWSVSPPRVLIEHTAYSLSYLQDLRRVVLAARG